MIRDFFKKQKNSKKTDAFLKKYKIPKAYININRKSIANAFFIGVFLAMMPMPFQMLAALLCMPFVKFNVPLTLTLVWISNPLSMPFIFYAEYLLGNWILQKEMIGDMTLSVEWFQNNLDTIFEPLLLGALISGVTLATLSRYLINYLWRRSIQKELLTKNL